MKSALQYRLALLAPLLIYSLLSCEGPGESGPKSVDYGPEIDVKNVEDAIAMTYRDSDPTQTKIGAYVHFETNDDVGDGTLKLVTADTAQTVTNRTEDADTVTFDLIENQVKYHQTDSTSSTVTRGYQLPFKKNVEAKVAEDWLRTVSVHRLDRNVAASGGLRVGGDLATGRSAAPTPAPTPEPSPSPTPEGQIKVTFHRLKAWEDSGPPPATIKATPGCLGIPSCQLTLRHVTFDIVFWSDAQGERTHVELTTSPQVPQVIGYEMSAVQPYIPGLMKSCVTQLIPVSDGRTTSKTLITECQQVDDFLF